MQFIIFLFLYFFLILAPSATPGETFFFNLKSRIHRPPRLRCPSSGREAEATVPMSPLPSVEELVVVVLVVVCAAHGVWRSTLLLSGEQWWGADQAAGRRRGKKEVPQAKLPRSPPPSRSCPRPLHSRRRQPRMEWAAAASWPKGTTCSSQWSSSSRRRQLQRAGEAAEEVEAAEMTKKTKTLVASKRSLHCFAATDRESRILPG